MMKNTKSLITKFKYTLKFFQANNRFHTTTLLSSSQYYPINDSVFGLTEEQKEVKFYIFFSIYFN